MKLAFRVIARDGESDTPRRVGTCGERHIIKAHAALTVGLAHGCRPAGALGDGEKIRLIASWSASPFAPGGADFYFSRRADRPTHTGLPSRSVLVLDAQREALTKAGCEIIHHEKESGAKRDRLRSPGRLMTCMPATSWWSPGLTGSPAQRLTC
jgi:hypothetical protein